MTRTHLVVAALLAVACGILVAEAVGDSVTVDEFAHLPAGLYYLRTGHFDLYNLSPPLLREIAALPVLFARPEGDFWHFTAEPHHWALGYEFMERNAARYQQLFVLGRLPMVALTLGLVAAVYACGRRYFGAGAGLAAAALTAFSPTILGHGHLVTTDVGSTLATFLATWAALEAFRAPSLRGALWLGFALGAAELTKFSALALYPIVLVLGVVAILTRRPRWHPAAVVLGAFLVSLVVINAGYLGRGSGAPLVAHRLESPALRAIAESWAGRIPLPLPADFIAGFDRQQAEAGGVYPVYLHGVWSTGGWWYYFPAAFALKETLPMLGLLVAGLAVLVTRRVSMDALVAVFLVAPPVVFAALLIGFTDIDLGVRYLLPAYPQLFLIGGLPFAAVAGSRLPRYAATVLAALHVAVGGAATPHHLAYMNALAGPADGRYRWLVDSNLDWGQELVRLRAYLAERGIGTVHLVYFGRVAPEVYGINYAVPNGPLAPGTYAVSASFLAGRPYFLYDHGRVFSVPVDGLAAFRRLQPTAVIGHSLFIYDL